VERLHFWHCAAKQAGAAELEQLAPQVQGKRNALQIVANATGEVEAVHSRLNLVETFYKAQDWSSLREVLTTIIERVDVRLDAHASI
jgi:hypothetical protein